MLRSTLLAALALLLGRPAQAGLVGDALKASKDKKAAAAAPAATYWFNPAEILIFRGQLFFSAFANNLAEGQELAVVLEGPGAPTAPLTSFKASKDGANFSYRWLSFTEGNLGTNKQGLPIDGLSAGEYHLRFVVNGAAVASQGFSLIDVPTALGGTDLQVDPRDRAWRPYLSGPYLLMWVPVDLTDGLVTFRGLFWADGAYAGEELAAPEVPRLQLGSSDLSDVPLTQLSPVVMRLKSSVGALDVAVVARDEAPLSAVHWVNTWSPDVVLGLSPVIRPPDGGNPLGALQATAFSAAQQEKWQSVRDGLASRQKDPDWKAPRGLLEPQVCALHDSAEARATYRDLLSLRAEVGDAAWTTWNALQVKKDPSATAAERAAADQAMSRGASSQAAYAAKVKELAARFDKQTAPYKDGCMAKLIPEGFQRVAEPPRL